MDDKIMKLLENNVPIDIISTMLNIPIDKIFETIAKTKNIIIKEPSRIMNLNSNTIVKMSYTLKDYGFPAEDLNSNSVFSVLSSSMLYKKQKIYLDGLERYDYRKTTIKEILKFKIPTIISYIVPSTKQIPSSLLKEFNVIDISLNFDDIAQFVSQRYPNFDKDLKYIYRKCNGNVNLIINNIEYCDLSPTLVTKLYSTEDLANMVLHNPDRAVVYRSLYFSEKPWWFVLSYIRYNIPFVYRSKTASAFDVVSFVDENKFKLDKQYLFSILAYSMPRANLFKPLRFPLLLKSEKNIKTEEKNEVKFVFHKTKKISKKPKQKQLGFVI